MIFLLMRVLFPSHGIYLLPWEGHLLRIINGYNIYTNTEGSMNQTSKKCSKKISSGDDMVYVSQVFIEKFAKAS